MKRNWLILTLALALCSLGLTACCVPCRQEPSPFDSVRRPGMNRDCHIPHWMEELGNGNITTEEYKFLVDGCEEVYE